MLRLKDIFLRKLTLIFLALFVALGISLYFWIKDIYIKEAKADLRHNIEIVSLEHKDLKNIDKFAKKIKDITGLRVTIIQDDGKVIAESNRDKNGMDNHKYRKEIIQARNNGYGSSIRHSHTLDKELLYVAKRVNIDGKIYYIRMARSIDQILGSFVNVAIKSALLFGLFAIFAYRIILGIGSDIQSQTQKIINFLEDMGSKDKDRHIQSSYSIEFSKITEILSKTAKTLAKRNKQKSKYTAKLKLANRQKDEIISAISHEFKNPIAVIGGYSQTIIDDKDISKEITEKFLHKIHANANKLSQMIDRLRLFVKLDENKQKLQIARCDISKITQNAIETLQANYPDREIILQNDETQFVQADSTLIEIAIINLIENALKYSQETPVKVELDNNSIKIIDEGIGIPAEEITKITKKFYRVDGNHWDNSMGIGLSLVANIVKMHGFSLHVKSRVNEGSVFEIRFTPTLTANS